jgi:hypothetical protein
MLLKIEPLQKQLDAAAALWLYVVSCQWFDGLRHIPRILVSCGGHARERVQAPPTPDGRASHLPYCIFFIIFIYTTMCI